MSLRFRKSIKLAPGIRMNLSGSGVSWSIGPRGASVSIGKRGAFLNTGIPGTGLSARHRLTSPTPVPSRIADNEQTQVEITVSIDDEGLLTFKDADGQVIPERLVDAAKKQRGEKIKELIQRKCDEINDQITSLGRIHEFTSPPRAHRFEPQAFSEGRPAAPALKSPGFLCRFFKSCVEKVHEENRRARRLYDQAVQAWELARQAHADSQQTERELLDRLNSGDEAAIEQYLESVLQDIAWPRETFVNFELAAPGVLALDVDLPEVDDMPNRTASVPQRGYRLTVKNMGPTQVQKLYLQHVHAIGFRIIGEAFASSPKINSVVLSAYSQRADKATGHVADEYLYSVRVDRERWIGIDFSNLAKLDVVDAFSRFELRRDMTKTGIFRPVEPLGV